MPITAMAAGALPSVGHVRPDHRVQRGLQHGHPHRGQRLAHVADLEHAEQVGRRDPGQLPAAQRARRRDRLAPGRPAGPAAATRALATLSGSTSSSLGPVGPVGVGLDDLGCPQQQVRHVRRGAQHVHQPLGHRALVAQRREEPALLGHRLGQPAVRQQPAVGIGGVRQPVQQRGQQHRLHATAPAALIGQGRKVSQCAAAGDW